MTSINFRAIKPPRLKSSVLFAAYNQAAEKFSKRIIQPEFETVWTDPPPFKVENKGGGKDVQWDTYADNEILFYNNEGTAIRWALMSSDWSSQTKPGRIPARPGRGHVVIAGRAAMTARGIAPRPGIEGRHWDKQIVAKEQKPYEREVLKELSDAVGGAWA